MEEGGEGHRGREIIEHVNDESMDKHWERETKNKIEMHNPMGRR